MQESLDQNEPQLSPADAAILKEAHRLLESPSLTIKLSNIIGKPVEVLLDKLPNKANEIIKSSITSSLYKVVDAAAYTMKDDQSEASPKLHKFGAAAAGAVGGFFGVAALAVELPVSTTIMMRSVLDIARSEGFSIEDPKVRLACIEVFSFTGNATDSDDSAESGYYIARAALAEVIKQAGAELAVKAAANAAGKEAAEGAIKAGNAVMGRALADLIEKVAARMGVQMTQKVAAQLVPAIGALTAATLNTMFTDFYQDMARGHFMVKKLEARYGQEYIEKEYSKLKNIKEEYLKLNLSKK